MASGRAKRLADLFHKFWSIRPAQSPIVSRHKALIRIHSDTEKGMAAIWSVEYTTRRSVVRCSWNAANIPHDASSRGFTGVLHSPFTWSRQRHFWKQRRLASGKDINGNTETKRRCFHAVRLPCSCCRPCFRVPVFLAEAILLVDISTGNKRVFEAGSLIPQNVFLYVDYFGEIASLFQALKDNLMEKMVNWFVS